MLRRVWPSHEGRRVRYRLRDRDGRIVAVHGQRVAEALASDGPMLDVGPGRLRPGLINPHDHLHRNHFPRLGAPPYADAYAWGLDLHERWADDIERGRSLPRRDALLFGALKTLLAGVTTVVHHDAWESDFDEGFPVRVARVRNAHSLGFDPDAVTELAGGGSEPRCVHVAEGASPASFREVADLERLGLLDSRLLAVHALAVDESDVRLLAERDVCVVWCPTSNAFLFGRTAPAALLGAVDVLVGSDSLLTADGTLLDELRAARVHGALDDGRLLDAVGPLAAKRLSLPAPVLSPGANADLVVLDRPVFEATAADVRLVVVGGVPRLADPRLAPLFELAGETPEELQLSGARKLVAAPLASIARRIVSEWPDAARILR